VTGLILQQAPGAGVLVERALEPEGAGLALRVAEASEALARRGVHVLNLSLGCFTHDNKAPLVLETALTRLDPDIVVISSAGNHAKRLQGNEKVEEKQRPLWPAALPRVVAVGAMDIEGKVPAWSPEPGTWPWVDALATGVHVTSSYVKGTVHLEDATEEFEGFAIWSGTSFAAAKLAGRVAAGTVPGRIGAAAALRELLRQFRDPDGVARIR